MAVTNEREFDVVLFGASGFVGRLTAEHLARFAPADARIALAGRDEMKLARVRSQLPGAAASWPLVTADAADDAALAALVARTRVVITTVGPYATYGMPLVRACAAAGTHYCDLTGEVLFVRRSIDECDATAKASGAKIVHSCGFDSVPSDIGVFVTAHTAESDGAGQLTSTSLAVVTMRGGVSGGTIDSARQQIIEATSDPKARKLLTDQYALAGGRPERPATGSTVAGKPLNSARGLSKFSPVRKDSQGRFTAPFVMASFNTRIVQRSAALLGYGNQFRYAEYTSCGRGFGGAVKAGLMTAGMGVGLAGFAFAPTRALLDKALPKPGEGPSAANRASGRFLMEIRSTTTTGARYFTRFGAPYDPGYGGTAIILGQVGLSLAFDTDAEGMPNVSGVLTPASGVGMAIVPRLRRHDFTIEARRETKTR